MKIACLGWGSLIWDPKDLRISSEWYEDGPNLPIEFARESIDGRMTLVLTKEAKESASLWAVLEESDIKTAKANLAKREGIVDKNIRYSIGYWDSYSDEFHGCCSKRISEWAIRKELDGVVWTNLKYGFRSGRDTLPTINEVIDHFDNLSSEKKLIAEQYVRKAPVQIRTAFREELENKLGWSPEI